MSIFETVALYAGLILYVLIAAAGIHWLWTWVKEEINV